MCFTIHYPEKQNKTKKQLHQIENDEVKLIATC